MSPVFMRLRKEILAIVYVATAIFILISLVSFDPTDPSFNSIGNKNMVHNYCGYFGSFLADLFYQALGFTSWISVIFLLKASFDSFKGHNIELSKLPWLQAMGLLMVSSSLLGLYLPEHIFFHNQITAGGLIGVVVAKALVAVFNKAGVSILLWASLTILLISLTQRSVADHVVTPLGKTLLFLKEKMIGWWQHIAQKRMTESKSQKIREKHVKQVEMKQTEIEETQAARFPMQSVATENISREKASEAQTSEERAQEERGQEEQAQEGIEEANWVENLEIIADYKPKKITKLKKPTRFENWKLPELSLLREPPSSRFKVDERELKKKTAILEEKLGIFDVNGKVTAVRPGPVVTMFEYKPNADVKLSKISELENDLKLAMACESLRIIAPLPGRDVVGIEVSNSERELVYLKEIVADAEFWKDSKALSLAIGKETNGTPRVMDLKKMPHLLVAGTTGSGKSVFIVSMITGLLFKHSPKTLRLILVDPKRTDLVMFNKIPHLLTPTVTDSRQAVSALRWAIQEMEKRNRSFQKFGARKLDDFNEMVSKISKEDYEKHEQANLAFEEMGNKKHEMYHYSPLPYIMVVVEEFSDLMMADKQNVETAVVRLAQMARAAGIHLLLAMQSPRKDVVTGLIKTNIPGRISMKVASKTDSRVILDQNGGESLLQHGDMLFLAPGVAVPQRHQGPFLSDEEIQAVTKFWVDQAEPIFDETALKFLEGPARGSFEQHSFEGMDEMNPDYEQDYDQVISFVTTQKTVSASLLQRKFSYGYPKAARLIDLLEKEGVVGPSNGSKPRQVIAQRLPEP